MRIHVELFGTLRDGNLPKGIERGKGTLELSAGATIGAVLEQLQISPSLRCAIMVNGMQETGRERVLEDSDKLTVLPPVAGGQAGLMSCRLSRPGLRAGSYGGESCTAGRGVFCG